MEVLLSKPNPVLRVQTNVVQTTAVRHNSHFATIFQVQVMPAALIVSNTKHIFENQAASLTKRMKQVVVNTPFRLGQHAQTIPGVYGKAYTMVSFAAFQTRLECLTKLMASA